MGEMRIMGRSGDTAVAWAMEQETAAAKEKFDELRAQGYAAFVSKPGSDDLAEEAKEFVEEAERILMVPPLAGG